MTGYQPIIDQYFLIRLVPATLHTHMAYRQEPTDTSKQPIRTRYLGHVTGYQPIRDQYLLIRSVHLLYQRHSDKFGAGNRIPVLSPIHQSYKSRGSNWRERGGRNYLIQ
eukprot:sb/3477471/